eukprot:scaffold271_cov252-Pinguiococcus_pyrenoidosus.AAC.6
MQRRERLGDQLVLRALQQGYPDGDAGPPDGKELELELHVLKFCFQFATVPHLETPARIAPQRARHAKRGLDFSGILGKRCGGRTAHLEGLDTAPTRSTTHSSTIQIGRISKNSGDRRSCVAAVSGFAAAKRGDNARSPLLEGSPPLYGG